MTTSSFVTYLILIQLLNTRLTLRQRLRQERKLTLIALAFMPLIILYSFAFHRKIGDGFKECDESEGRLSAMVQENLTGVRVVRAFGRERYERDRFGKQNSFYTSLWVKLGRLMAFFWCSADILSGVQIMLVVIFGAVFCIQGSLLEGEYIAFISYNSLLVWPIRQLGRMISEMSKAGVAVDRIGYIVNSPIETDCEDAITPDLTGDITFEQSVELSAGEKRVVKFDPSHFSQLSEQALKLWWPKGYGEPYLYDAEFEFKIADAISEVMSIFRRANKYVDETAPWVLAKDEASMPRLKEVMYNLTEAIRIATILLKPFLTTTPDKIFASLILILVKSSISIQYSELLMLGSIPITVFFANHTLPL